MIPRLLLPCIYSLVACASAIPVLEQQVLNGGSPPLNAEVHTSENNEGPSRRLSGRFLHVTDFHLDPHYKAGSLEDEDCHHKKGSAGPLGAEGSDCDSPRTLIDETFNWIEKNLKDKIDFVVWTGDSARHDNDEKIPRTIDEIIQLNEVLAGKFIDLFKDSSAARGLSTPIIPTFGNNDIMPHNIFKDGPNRWTKKFADIWGRFIPEHEKHTFVEGGWFTSEVIPNKLVVISLNTMYFFESNSAVDGCSDKSEPGFEHMEWLRIQLELLRGRQMKAILIGHVPPARAGSKRNWDETCWQKYTLWLHRFRDVVIGSIYGHMNLDHFMLQDSHKVNILDSSEIDTSNQVGDFTGNLTIQSRSSYLSSLRDDWSKMPSPPDGTLSDQFPFNDWFSEDTLITNDSDDIITRGSKKKRRRFLKKIGGQYAERFSVSLVSPSIVPNYFPALRVIEYNITGLEDAIIWADTSYGTASSNLASDELPKKSIPDVIDQLNMNKKKKKPHFKIPDHPSPTAPPGPAYSNQALTWLNYAQYYINLTKVYSQTDSTGDPKFVLKGEENETDLAKLYELEYDTRDDMMYKMKDLTVRSYYKLATRIADKNPGKDIFLDNDDNAFTQNNGGSPVVDMKKKHRNCVWRTFLNRAFVGFLGSDELDDIPE